MQSVAELSFTGERREERKKGEGKIEEAE